MSDFPYGSEPTHPHLRERLIRLAMSHVEGRKSFEQHFGRKSDKPLVMEVDCNDLVAAFKLTPVTAPNTEDAVIITGMSNGVLTRELDRRLNTGLLDVARLFQVLGPLGKKPHQITDEDLITELNTRLKRPEFVHRLGDRLGNKLVTWLKDLL